MAVWWDRGGESDGADRVRSLNSFRGRFLPGKNCKRRHLPRADVVILESQEMWLYLPCLRIKQVRYIKQNTSPNWFSVFLLIALHI